MAAFLSEFGTELAADIPAHLSQDLSSQFSCEATERMNRMYRRQRHIYDGTRRYYLLGRDTMIANLKPLPDANVLEIGCGTGRNLVLAARLFPNARWFGIDVSTEMLTSAINSVSRQGLSSRVRVAHGDATAFDPQVLFGIPAFEHVMISYSLSMIPNWTGVLETAIARLKPGGRLHIVDFGRQERLPGIVRALLMRWLKLFDVTPRDELQNVLSAMAESSQAELTFERPFRGYAQYSMLTLPSGSSKP